MINSVLASRKINRDIPVPFYYQIVQIMREVIRDMDADPEFSEMLPSETELCTLFQTNRGTLRHAMDVLIHEGLIYRKKGRGTFIRRRRIELDLVHFCSTTDELLARGYEPSTSVLKITCLNPLLHIQKKLWLTETDQVWELYRLRLADGEPISLQCSYVPVALSPDLDKQDLTKSLFSMFRTEYQIELNNADQIIRARAVTPEEARLLQINAGDSVIEISRVSYDQNDEPVEYMDSLWRGDRYDMRVHLSRED